MSNLDANLITSWFPWTL